MKHLVFFAALFFAAYFNASAYDFSAVSPSGHTLYYNIVDGHAEVVRPGNGFSYNYYVTGDVTIPDTVTFNNITYFVTVLADQGDLGTFQGCVNITSVSLPNTITDIQSNTFRDCSGLISINIPANVTNIGYHAFWNCTSLNSVYFYSNTPPSLGNAVFSNTPSIKIFYVVCGYYQNYINIWGSSYNIVCYDPLQFYVNINTNDSTWGIGSYRPLGDSIVEITATANYGYRFDHWSYGSTANPDTLLLSNDVAVTAIFAKNQYTVTGTANDDVKGTVTGSATVDYLDSVTLMASANYGYQFLRWSDYPTDNPRTVAATGNINLTAIFDFDQYTLSLAADTSIHGTVSGAGEYNYLSEHTISANASYGYHFVAWNDSVTDNPRTITLTRDTAFVALFAKNQYTLTILSSDTSIGSVTGGGVYDYLDTATLTATAIEHYHFVRWSDGNTTNPRHMVVTSDLNRTAVFSIDTHAVSLQAANITHGTISGNGNYPYGTAATVEAIPYSGYQFSHWSNGSTYNPYTFAVIGDVQLTAYFYGVGIPYQDTIVVYDTIFITVPVHDTTYLWQYDTTYIDNYIHDTTIVDNWIYDTTIVVDTLWLTQYDTVWLTLYDTVWLHDTVVVHDTIYITQEGIGDVAESSIKLYQKNGQIVVEGAAGKAVYMYDINGRLMMRRTENEERRTFDVPVSGAYLIKVGELPARKIVVIR